MDREVHSEEATEHGDSDGDHEEDLKELEELLVDVADAASFLEHLGASVAVRLTADVEVEQALQRK